jgi:hypothetical protein
LLILTAVLDVLDAYVPIARLEQVVTGQAPKTLSVRLIRHKAHARFTIINQLLLGSSRAVATSSPHVVDLEEL